MTTEQTTSWPPVSVVIVTKGHHAEAEQAVRSILSTDYPAAQRQIIVLEETNEPAPIAGEGIEYHALPLLHRGVAFARNRGLELARQEIVLFTDDDCIVAPGWIKALVEPLQRDPSIGALAGAVLVPPCGPVGQCENILGFPGGGAKFLHRSGGRPHPIATFSTCNCAIHRKVTGPVQFREGFQSAGEDELLSREISARHSVRYQPDAVVRHQPRDSFSGVFQWFVRRGQARVQMAHYAPSRWRYILRMASISPLLRLLVLAAGLAAICVPILPVLAGFFALYYVLTLVRFRWAWAYYPSAATLLLLPLVKLTMDFGMDTGVLLTWMKGSR